MFNNRTGDSALDKWFRQTAKAFLWRYNSNGLKLSVEWIYPVFSSAICSVLLGWINRGRKQRQKPQLSTAGRRCPGFNGSFWRMPLSFVAHRTHVALKRRWSREHSQQQKHRQPSGEWWRHSDSATLTKLLLPNCWCCWHPILCHCII